MSSALRSGRAVLVVDWLRTNDRWAHVVLFGFFAVLILTGTTTSNITQDYLQQALGAREGIVLGTPQEIRWDEYLSGSPLYLSIMATHGLPATSPLAEQAGLAMRYSEGGVFGSLVFFDGTLLRLSGIVPESILFSLHWWLPTVLFLAAIPVWFRQLGFSNRAGWLAGLVVAASPSVAWWSIQPVSVMGYTLAGCVALLAGFRRLREGRPVTMTLCGLAAAVLLAGMPSAYLIWALILSLPLLLVSAGRILVDSDARPALRWGYLSATGALTAVLALAAVNDVRRGVDALAATEYPGDRRAASAATPFEALFGAPVSHTASNSPILDGWADAGGVINHSELAMSWTIAFVVLGALVLRIWPRATGTRWREWLPVSVLTIWGAIWLAWSALSFGEVSAKVPVFAQVPSLRAAQVVGAIGVIALCLAVSKLRLGARSAAAIAAAAGIVTLYAGSLLQRLAVPEMSTAVIWLAALGTAAAVFLALRWHERIWALAAVVVLAFLPVVGAGTVTHGLGSYRESPAADYIADAATAARSSGEVWASDFRAMDATMLANGMPSLTGQQLSGPVRAEWQHLDPSGAAEEAWNRGGSRIRATWRDTPGIDITSNGYNVITIDANPCSLHDAYPRLSAVLTRETLTDSCVRLTHTLAWKDTPVHVYEFIEGDS